MKIPSFFILLSVAFSVCCTGAPAAKKVQKLAPPTIVSNWKTERLKVAETGSFSAISVPQSEKKSQKTTAADAVSEKGKKFTWKPSPLLSSAIRIADLTGAALSADGSLAVVAERVGGEGKANSTRLIMFDVPNSRIAGGFVIPEMLVSNISFLPGSQSELLGVKSAFEPFKVKEGMVRIDLKERNVVDAFDSPYGKILSYSAGEKGNIFFTVAGSSALYELNIDSFGYDQLKDKSRISSPRVCAAGKNLVVYGKEGVEVFRKDQGRWCPDEEIIKAPSPSFAPVNCQVTDAEQLGVCFLGNSEEDAWYLQGSSFQKLKERISGVFSWDKGEKLLFIEVASNNRVSIFNMPEAAENVKPATPNRLRPANRNGTFALLSAPGLKKQLLHIDNRGNLFLLDYSRLIRWKKTSVYIADRTAFR